MIYNSFASPEAILLGLISIELYYYVCLKYYKCLLYKFDQIMTKKKMLFCEYVKYRMKQWLKKMTYNLLFQKYQFV